MQEHPLPVIFASWYLALQILIESAFQLTARYHEHNE